MKLKGDAKFKGKLTRRLKNDMSNLVNFHSSSRKSENLHFNGLILSKAKFEEKLTLGSQNDIMNLANFYASSGKSKHFHFVVLLLLKVYYV